MFQLNNNEFNRLRSQIVTSNEGRGGRRFLPYAFTEHGVAMLSSVLKSKRAIHMNILIIRAFVKMRHFLAEHKALAKKSEYIRTQSKTSRNSLNRRCKRHQKN